MALSIISTTGTIPLTTTTDWGVTGSSIQNGDVVVLLAAVGSNTFTNTTCISPNLSWSMAIRNPVVSDTFGKTEIWTAVNTGSTLTNEPVNYHTQNNNYSCLGLIVLRGADSSRLNVVTGSTQIASTTQQMQLTMTGTTTGSIVLGTALAWDSNMSSFTPAAGTTTIFATGTAGGASSQWFTRNTNPSSGGSVTLSGSWGIGNQHVHVAAIEIFESTGSVYTGQSFFFVSPDTLNAGNLLWPDRSKIFSSDTWRTGTETTFSLGYDYAPDGTRTASRVQIPGVVSAQMQLIASGCVSIDGEDEPLLYQAMKPDTVYTYSVYSKFLAPHNEGISMQIHQYDITGTYISSTSSVVWDNHTALDTWTRATWSFRSYTNTGYGYWSLYTAWSPVTATDALFWGAKMEEGSVATGGPNIQLTNPSGTSVAWQTVNGDQYNRYKKIVVNFVTPAGCTNVSVYPLRDSGQVSGTYADVLVWGASLVRVDGADMVGGGKEGISSYPLIGTAVDGNWFSSNGTSSSYSASIAPDGTNRATRVYSTTPDHSLSWNESTVSASVSYSFSFYARRNSQGVSASYSVYDWDHNADIVPATSYFSQLTTEPNLLSSAQARSIGPDLGGNTWFLQTNMTASYNALAAPNGLTEATRYTWPSGNTGPLEIAARYNGDIYIPVRPGYNYCWSMWVRNNGTTGSWSSNFDIAFYDGGKNPLESNWVHSKNMSGSLTGSNWARVYVTGTAPQRTAYALCSALNGYSPSWPLDVYVWGAKLEIADIPTGDPSSL